MRTQKRPRVKFAMTGTCIRCKNTHKITAEQVAEAAEFGVLLSKCCQMPYEIEKVKVSL